MFENTPILTLSDGESCTVRLIGNQFQWKPNHYITNIIDRKDNSVKLMKLSYSSVLQIVKLLEFREAGGKVECYKCDCDIEYNEDDFYCSKCGAKLIGHAVVDHPAGKNGTDYKFSLIDGKYIVEELGKTPIADKDKIWMQAGLVDLRLWAKHLENES